MSRKQIGALSHQVTQPALHQVADHGAADGLGHHQTHPGRRASTLMGTGARRHQSMDHQNGPTAAPAATYDLAELGGGGQAVARGEHARQLTPQAARRSRPLRRRAASTARPARVRMRRRKPWVLCRRRLFGWNVRLLKVFTPLRGLADESGHRVGRASRSPVAGQLAPPAHASPNCHGHAAPVDAGVTCSRYALGPERVNSTERRTRAATSGPVGDRASRAAVLHSPSACGYRARNLWTTVDSRASGLLASHPEGSSTTTDRPRPHAQRADLGTIELIWR